MADEQDPPEAGDEALENFGNDPIGAPSRDVYYANFNGDEINGRTYQLGERIADDVDAGTLAYLVQNGRITPASNEDGEGIAGGGEEAGGGEDGAGSGSDPFSAYDLDANERAEAEQLKADNDAASLRKLAADEDVELESDDNKSDVAAKIMIARRD
jgi:hypothetical protein